MADLGLQFMQQVSDVLISQVPLEGGWHATRLDSPVFPIGYIDITSSVPIRGQKYYSERQTGVISIWTRASKTRPADPAKVFILTEQAHRLLGAAILSTPTMAVLQFQCGALTPQNRGSDWGRTFTISAITHEVTNG